MRKKKQKWWDLSHRKQRKCERCGKKIKMGRYCYYCIIKRRHKHIRIL